MRTREELEKIFDRISKKYSFEDAHLELATDGRMNAIIKFGREQFGPDEPMSKSLQMVYDDEAELLLRSILSEHLSIVLVSDKTDELIAVRLCNVSTKAHNGDVAKNVNNQNLVKIFNFIHHKDEKCNVYDKYGVDKLVHFIMLGVDREHRRKGIATNLMNVAMEFYAEIGFDKVVIKAEGTSNYANRIYERLGFETLIDMPYEEYEVDGEVVFKDTGEHKSCKIYAKVVKQ